MSELVKNEVHLTKKELRATWWRSFFLARFMELQAYTKRWLGIRHDSCNQEVVLIKRKIVPQL